jgi:hypothetical protein
MRTHTRVRQGGTRETAPKSWQERINAIRAILTEGYAKVDGCIVDLTTAHCVVTVFDALKPDQQAKFASFPVWRMVDIAWKLVKKAEAS